MLRVGGSIGFLSLILFPVIVFGWGGGASGGLGGAFPIHYRSVAESAGIERNFRWENVNGSHLRAWREASMGSRRLTRFEQQNFAEVMFRSVVEFGANLSLQDREDTLVWWNQFLEQTQRERVPDPERCARGIRNGARGDVEGGCGLALLEVSLAPGGSWLARQGIQLTTGDPLVAGQPYLEIDARMVRQILLRSAAQLRDLPDPSAAAPDVVFAVSVAFHRMLLRSDGIGEQERAAIGREWAQFFSGRSISVDAYGCMTALSRGNVNDAQRSCGLSSLNIEIRASN